MRCVVPLLTALLSACSLNVDVGPGDTGASWTLGGGGGGGGGGESCSATIPADVVVVKGSDTYNNQTADFWVCGGATTTISAISGDVFVDPGATVTVSGITGTVYVRDGATVTVNGSVGGLQVEQGADVNDSLNSAVWVDCATLELDASAVGGGC